MLINLSNHPSDKWSEEQMSAAKLQFGKVLDIQFPNVEPNANEYDVAQIAESTVSIIGNMMGGNNLVIHVMGEMTLTYALVKRFHKRGIRCVASTTKRETYEEDGRKISVFKFVQYRDYEK